MYINSTKYILHFKPDTIKSILNKVLKIHLYSKINSKVKKFWNINIFVFFSVLLMYQILSIVYIISNLQINFCRKKPNIFAIFNLSSRFFCICICSQVEKNYHYNFIKIINTKEYHYFKTRYIYFFFHFR